MRQINDPNTGYQSTESEFVTLRDDLNAGFQLAFDTLQQRDPYIARLLYFSAVKTVNDKLTVIKLGDFSESPGSANHKLAIVNIGQEYQGTSNLPAKITARQLLAHLGSLVAILNDQPYRYQLSDFWREEMPTRFELSGTADPCEATVNATVAIAAYVRILLQRIDTVISWLEL